MWARCGGREGIWEANIIKIGHVEDEYIVESRWLNDTVKYSLRGLSTRSMIDAENTSAFFQRPVYPVETSPACSSYRLLCAVNTERKTCIPKFKAPKAAAYCLPLTS